MEVLTLRLMETLNFVFKRFDIYKISIVIPATGKVHLPSSCICFENFKLTQLDRAELERLIKITEGQINEIRMHGGSLEPLYPMMEGGYTKFYFAKKNLEKPVVVLKR